MAERVRPFDCEVEVKLLWYYAHRLKDIDSKLKCLLDALESKEGTFGAYKNDNQIGDLRVIRNQDNQNPRCVVTIKRRR